MKYIVITCTRKRTASEDSVIQYPFIFPNNLVHDHVAKALTLLISLLHPTYRASVTSAGEVSSMSIEGPFVGESTSIGVRSDKGDTQLVRMCDYGSNIVNI